MDSQVLHIMTISNSIIGVSLLAMPYCFKQCGIILSILILIASSLLSRLSCHLLLKSAIMARRRTFEVLAFHTFGSLGKFITEIGLIGFLLGTCIAFFVIMGDLGPTIIAKMTDTKVTDTMRTSILMALALFCVLPLSLLRNIDSLSSVCTATVGFYCCLMIKIIVEALPHLFTGDWIDKVELWRPSGILQCLPIFTMALFCQTQIFEIYQVIPNVSLEKMNNLIKVAVNICSSLYIFVGTFGYIAFCNQTFTGNILMSFSSTFLSEVIKIGFVLSVAFSFPLVIFPCRASLYSLLYKHAYSLHEGTDKYIPEGRFKGITFVIIFIPLLIGIMIPNIELVLGLMGSTIGIMICVIFPAICFICVSTKNTNERTLAQVMLFFGILIMVLGTYANLYAMENQINDIPSAEGVKLDPMVPKVIDIPNITKLPDIPKILETIEKVAEPPKEPKIKDVPRQEPLEPQAPDSNQENVGRVPVIKKVEEVKPVIPKDVEALVKKDNLPEPKEVGQAPLQPQESFDSKIEQIKPQEFKDEEKIKEVEKEPAKPEAPPQLDIEAEPNKATKIQQNASLQQIKIRHEPPQPIEPIDTKPDNTEVKKPEIIVKPPLLDKKKSEEENLEPAKIEGTNKIKLKQEIQSVQKPDSEKQTVDIEAIKKEDKELLEQEKEELTEEEKKNAELLKTLEKQNIAQQKLVEESKKVLEEIKQRQQALEEKKQRVMAQEKQEQLKKVEEVKVDNKNVAEPVAANVKPVESLNLNKGNLLPLPIALSKQYDNKNTNAQDVKADELVKVQQDNNIVLKSNDKTDQKPLDAKKDQSNKENDLPVLHREIRSIDKSNQKDDKMAAKEEPVIKMNMKLSNPEIISIKDQLADSNAKVDSSNIKPLSRDLKSYKSSEKE